MKRNQAITAIEWYRSGDFQSTLTQRQREVLEVLIDANEPLTLKEITAEINRRFYSGNLPQPDSSVSGRLNELEHVGVATTAGNAKRPCRINGITKQCWSLVRSDEEGQLELAI